MISSMAANGEIRPFRAEIPEEAVVDLRRRIAATRWPDKETVADQAFGSPARPPVMSPNEMFCVTADAIWGDCFGVVPVSCSRAAIRVSQGGARVQW